jgi:hypothetical protein
LRTGQKTEGFRVEREIHHAQVARKGKTGGYHGQHHLSVVRPLQPYPGGLGELGNIMGKEPARTERAPVSTPHQRTGGGSPELRNTGASLNHYPAELQIGPVNVEAPFDVPGILGAGAQRRKGDVELAGAR